MSSQILVILIIIAYLLVLLLISRLTSRRANNNTFFIGNRKMPWVVVALAMITAPISGVTFISVPGMVLSKGYGYLQMCLGFIVGYFIIAWVLVPLYYRHNIVSIYSFLETRFGKETYKTGAWFFLISKILGTAVKFLVVCFVLQMLVFQPLGIPFIVNVFLTISLIGLYTFKGGVKTVIWADIFKSLCLVTSIGLCIYFICRHLGFSGNEFYHQVVHHPSSRVFFFDNPSEGSYFWKQFIAGIFLVVAMTGLDQDMMQHTLSCKNSKSSKKNLVLSSFLQFAVIALFLSLGTLLVVYMERCSIEPPSKSDDLFTLVAFHSDMPLIVGILFILGLVSASYSSVGSALTSLTTSYTVDIVEAPKKYQDKELGKVRNLVHIAISLVLIGVIMGFYYLNNQDAISAVFTLATYTYGPILGLFVFGIFSKKQVNGRYVTAICFAAPLLAWLFQWLGKTYFDYTTGYELLLINAGFVLLGLSLLPSYSLSKGTGIVSGLSEGV
ncbi:MAG: sodium:solute symporter [Muribaculaceae bacterium]|nr:sodium:solute symporter [Muribaculaceae bacterium]